MIKRIRLRLVSPTEYDWTGAALEITRNCTSIYDKSKAIYEWLIDNIDYDTSYKIHNADTAWKKHKGVCQAYCELFYRIGIAVNLDVRIISGIGRKNAHDNDISENHCWIAVNRNNTQNSTPFYPEYIEYNEGEKETDVFCATKGLNTDNVMFIEPTWGAGTIANGKYVKTKHDMSWFDVSPYWMIFSHFPQNAKDQLLGDYIMSKQEFQRLPYFIPKHKDYGFDATDLLSFFLQIPYASFPLIYPSYSNYVEFIDIPIDSKLHIGKEYTFIIKKKEYCTLAIINERDFIIDDDIDSLWSNNHDIWNITFVPKHNGNLFLSLRDNYNNNKYNAILEYELQL